MSGSFNIENILNTGYYPTSRARSPTKPSSSRFDTTSSSSYPYTSSAPSSRPPPSYEYNAYTHSYDAPPPVPPKRNYGPRPLVEDEEESLKREHEPIKSTYEDEVPSRGDIDQASTIMEVHEHNPERRFVILKSNAPEDGGKEKKPSEERRQRPPKNTQDEPSKSKAESKAEAKAEPKSSRKADANLKSESSAGTDGSKPRLEKRRSRQDLPRLDTEFQQDIPPTHHRARSMGNTSRPEHLSDRKPRPYAEQNLNPEVIKHSSGSRERTYQNYDKPQGSRERPPSYRSKGDERRFDESHPRGSSTPSSRPSKSSHDIGKRPMSNDRAGESRYYGEYKEYAPSRSNKADKSSAQGRSDRDNAKYYGRDPNEGRSGEEQPKHRHKKSIVVQDGSETLPLQDMDEVLVSARPKGRGLPIPAPIIPLPMPMPPGYPNLSPVNPRGAPAFPGGRDAQTANEWASTSQLPYPVDDDRLVDPFANPSQLRSNADWQRRGHYEGTPSVSMPDMPEITIGPEAPLESRMGALSLVPQVPPSQPWQPPSFDPDRDGVRLDKPVNTYRRYSEKADSTPVPQFPECRRKSPVAGKMDWLTLTRTEFNICPECYEGVFGNTQFRTQFQPLLRPSDRPIACDFGLYPWYRIAWLLTLKNEMPDLRLFHQVANIMSVYRDYPCPGDRPAVRDWLTIVHPYSRLPVYDFAVCAQCAGIIETLLPNLAGLFEELDPRAEPLKRTCSMRCGRKRKRFVMYFDAMETTSDTAFMKGIEPDIESLADDLEKMTIISECQRDTPVTNGYWHVMQFLPQFSVCGECFEEVVRPRISDDNIIGANFYKKPQKIPVATCQLYSARMRDIFAKACRWNDHKYLEGKVIERMQVEADIHHKLSQLESLGHSRAWVEDQTDKLIQEWKEWE